MATLCLFVWPGQIAVQAASFEDGVYELNYTVLQADSDSASIANDYFQKPAYLIVEQGKKTLEIVVNHSKWVKELQAAKAGAFQHVKVIHDNQEEDYRLVSFPLESELEEALLLEMHVKIEEMEPTYDHRYTVRLAFDASSLQPGELLPRPEAKSLPGVTWYFLGAAAMVVLCTFSFIVLKRKKRQ